MSLNVKKFFGVPDTLESSTSDYMLLWNIISESLLGIRFPEFCELCE